MIGQSQKIIAHAHNDYDQAIPLYSALSQGFQSIEVDICRENNQLHVSHDCKKLSHKPLLESTYLDPLYLILNSYQNWRFELDSITRWLLIDIKKYDEQTLEVLHEMLLDYNDILYRNNEPAEWKPLKVILSGNIPRDAIYKNKSYYYFFLDGREEDIKKNRDSFKMPLISIDYRNVADWRGFGQMKRKELRRIHPLIQKTLAQGKKIRFWDTADNEKMWNFLMSKKVSVISVDDQKRFANYLESYYAKN